MTTENKMSRWAAKYPRLAEGSKVLIGVFSGITVGIGAARMLTKYVLKKENAIIEASALAVGVAGTVFTPGVFKYMFASIAAYGAIMLLRRLVSGGATTPEADPGTSGLSGVIPDKVKVFLNDFLPNFSGIDQDGISGEDEDFGEVEDLGEMEEVIAGFGNLDTTQVLTSGYSGTGMGEMTTQPELISGLGSLHAKLF